MKKRAPVGYFQSEELFKSDDMEEEWKTGKIFRRKRDWLPRSFMMTEAGKKMLVVYKRLIFATVA